MERSTSPVPLVLLSLLLLLLSHSVHAYLSPECQVTGDTIDCSNRRYLHFVPSVIVTEGGAQYRKLLMRKGRLGDERITALLSRYGVTIPKLLDISGNAIERLHISNDLSRLRALVLDRNAIRGAALVDTLRSLAAASRLRLLSLVDNGVRALTASLRWPQSLRTLDLSDNEITSLAELSLRPLRLLERLSLNGNRLTSLDDAPFSALTRLGELSLNDNYLRELSPRSFSGLDVALERLYLEGNRLTSVRSRDFVGLSRLRLLSLDRNRLRVLSAGCLSCLSLVELRLSSMPTLIAVERGALTSLPNLRTLSIARNPNLTYVDDDAFDALPALVTLRIADNPALGVLPAELATKLPAVRRLLLSGNGYRCDCTAVWITRALSAPASAPVRVALARLRCAAPASLRGAPLSTTPTDKSCRARALVYPKRANIRLGSSETFACRRIGYPLTPAPGGVTPRAVVRWRLPTGQWLNGSRSNLVSHWLDAEGRLTVRAARLRDQGEYRCLLVSGGVADSGQLTIRGGDLSLRRTARTDTTVSVMWTRGGGATGGRGRGYFDWTGYAIQCGMLTGNEHKHDIIKLTRIGTHTRSLTIGKLRAATSYRVCIVYYMRAEAPLETLDCLRVDTLSPDYATRGIRRLDVRPIIGAALALAFVACVGCVAVSRCCDNRRRHRTYIAYPLKGGGISTVRAEEVGAPGKGDYRDHEVMFFNSNSKTCLVG